MGVGLPGRSPALWCLGLLPYVGMWGDMFLLFLELGRKRRRKCCSPRNQFPSKGAPSFLSPSPQRAEALHYVIPACAVM